MLYTFTNTPDHCHHSIKPTSQVLGVTLLISDNTTYNTNDSMSFISIAVQFNYQSKTSIDHLLTNQNSQYTQHVLPTTG